MSLSFDPARDGPEAMARYGRSFSRDADWSFVTTRSPEALAPILADYDQRLQSDLKTRQAAGPTSCGSFSSTRRAACAISTARRFWTRSSSGTTSLPWGSIAIRTPRVRVVVAGE